ncbi:MAG: glycosyltransferase family 4 protein [Paracoccaceae bacterium]
MRILQISHNHHVVGGSDRVFFETSALLEQAGHEVIPFCLSSPNDQPSPWSAYFPKGADTANPRITDTARYFYNLDARKRLAALLDATGPIDVAHLHIYHGKLTPAILPVLKAQGIPVVQTLHEYKLACPVYTMQRGGTNCDACVGGSILNSIRHRCKDGSVLKSTIMAAEMAVSRMLGDVRLIDRFICVSAFQRDVMIRAGIPPHKLVTLHNFVATAASAPLLGHDDYLLYFGRIETLKGLPTLLAAVAGTGHRLLIAGDGSWTPHLVDRIREMPNVSYLGFQSGPDLATLIGRAKAVVVPSEWYENCPMSVLEAKAAGRPVVAARIGGIPELVRDNVDGFLFQPGDADDLRNCLQRLDQAPHPELSENATADIAERFSGKVHLSALLRIYAEARAQPEYAQNDRRGAPVRYRSKDLHTEPKPGARSGSPYR